VLGQSVSFDKVRWKNLLGELDSGLWPPELDACERGRKWPWLDREQVFCIGRGATNPVGAARTYVAASVWGSGTSPREVTRRVRAFAGGAEARQAVGERLTAAVEVLLREGPVIAYDTLHGAGRFKVTEIGPSFGTKLLYFAGFDRMSGPQEPLILDRYVAQALNWLCGFDWPTQQGGWSVKQYATYLSLAHAWADEWGTRPDVVERSLFAVGQAGRMAVAVLSGLPLDA
jgi:hypothetical protein